MNKAILSPKAYVNSVIDITIEFLEQNKIKGLILDVDNTLIDYNKNMLVGLDKWIEEIKQSNIKLYILSNINKKKKKANVANKKKIE